MVSLNDVHQRYRHARQELKKLYALLDRELPEIVYRMSFVHAVTVMEAYLMYCAKALLEHDWPLERYFEAYYLPFAGQQEREAGYQQDAAFGFALLQGMSLLV
ncbi:hypothetical protein [Klebsiella pneumoniae]|uniref:hypothetical protein n=1 Tax=Klebsiella pneumoniae TaxID=573 RepID=UPI001D1274F9|nr:hypothetical protein [Klebsiella pneumoniae]